MAAAGRDDGDGRLAHLSGREERPLDELLVYVGLELRSLCTAATLVESTVERLIADNPDNLPETVQGLQELDRLIQHMDGLADYLAALAEAAHGVGAVDPTEARKVLKVARLREGLAGATREAARETPASGGAALDDFEFF